MKSYPLEINYSDFSGTPPIPPKLKKPSVAVTKSFNSGTIKNAISTQSCGPIDIWIYNPENGKRSPESGCRKSTDDPSHPVIASTDASRFCFAPLQEEIWIRWKHLNPELISESKLELFCHINGKREKIWTKTFHWDNCPEDARTKFKGDLKFIDEYPDKQNNPGLRSVTLDDNTKFDTLFPDGCVTAEFSPYQLKLSVVPKANTTKNWPNSVWMYFDINVKLELFWGEDKMIPTGRNDDGMTQQRLQEIVAEEKTIFNALRDKNSATQYKIADTENHEIVIDSNIFKVGQEEYHTDYVKTTEHWGKGTRIPILAEIKVKNSNNELVSEPRALGKVQVLWDWEDQVSQMPKWQPWTAGTSTERTKDFLKSVFETHNDPTDPHESDNCPVDLGGKRSKSPKSIFPNQTGYTIDDGEELRDGVFPFSVLPCLNRKWAAISHCWRKGALKGKTGALFQPSRMAGDKYKLTACVVYHKDLLLAATKGTDIRQNAGDAQAATGMFEVFRQANLLYIDRANAAAINLDTVKTSYKQELGMILKVQNAPLNEGRYQQTVKDAIEKYEKTKESAFLGLHLHYALLPQANGSPAVTIRTLDEFKQTIRNEFENRKIFRLDLPGSKEFRLEIVRSASGAEGMVFENENFLYVLSTNDRNFLKDEEITGSISDKKATIKAVFHSCWKKTIKPPIAHDRERTVVIWTTSGEMNVTFRPLVKTLITQQETEISKFLNDKLSAFPQNSTFEIEVRGIFNDATDRTRRNLVQTFIEGLFPNEALLEKQALLTKWETRYKQRIYDDYPDTDPEDFGRKSAYKTIVTTLMQETLTDYVEAVHQDFKGAVLFNFPGRDSVFKPKVSGAFFPEKSLRHRAITYLATVTANFLINDKKGRPINYKTEASVAAHEMAHALFIPHARHVKDKPPGPPQERGQHVEGDTCIMNYDSDSNNFCGFCMLRLRGWDWKDIRDTYPILEITKWDLHFAPVRGVNAENLQIKYDIARLQNQRVKLQITSDHYPGNVIYERDLTAPEKTDGEGKLITWDGEANCAGGDFSGNKLITPLYAPYKVQLVEDAAAAPRTEVMESRAREFSVLYHSITIERGTYIEDNANPPQQILPTPGVGGGANWTNHLKWVQYRLNELGYFAGPVDGTHNDQTKRAIKRYTHTMPVVAETDDAADAGFVAALALGSHSRTIFQHPNVITDPSVNSRIYIDHNYYYYQEGGDLRGLRNFGRIDGHALLEAQKLDRFEFPLEAKLTLVSRTDEQGTRAGVDSPEALGPVEVEWTVLDPPEDLSILPQNIQPTSPSVASNYIDLVHSTIAGNYGNAQDSQDNCPEEAGGFRGSNYRYFGDGAILLPFTCVQNPGAPVPPVKPADVPLTAADPVPPVMGSGVIPYPVFNPIAPPVQVRYFSTVHQDTGGHPHKVGRTGVLFTGSYIAGDNYAIKAHISFEHHARKNDLEKLHTDFKGDTFDKILDTKTGKMTIWRRREIAAIVDWTSQVTPPDWTSIKSVFAVAHTEIVQAPQLLTPNDIFPLPIDKQGYIARVVQINPPLAPQQAAMTFKPTQMYPLDVPPQPAGTDDNTYRTLVEGHMDAMAESNPSKEILVWVATQIRNHIKQNYPNGLVLFRFEFCSPVEIRSAARRIKGLTYKRPQVVEANYMKEKVKGLGVPYGVAAVGRKGRDDWKDSFFYSHEISHCYYLTHSFSLTGGMEVRVDHDLGDLNCIMGYPSALKSVRPNLDMSHNSDYTMHFCGKCILKLRGWKIADSTQALLTQQSRTGQVGVQNSN